MQRVSGNLIGMSAWLDEQVHKTNPWTLIVATVTATALVVLLLQRWASRREWNWKATVKSGLQHIPAVQRDLGKQRAKLQGDLTERYFHRDSSSQACLQLPERGLTLDVILRRLDTVAGQARSGKNTGAYYFDDKNLDAVIRSVSDLARRTNPLHADLSPLLIRLEAEVVRMTAHMFHGDHKVFGNITTGGTDSIRHAVFTARERARAQGMGAGWEMVVPSTAHPAFAKAANEYGIKLVRTPVHSQAFEADVGAMRKAINGNTILVVASCPGYPHGIIDPIEQISAMLESVDKKGRIGLHVDSCLGGFVVPFMEAAGFGSHLKTRFGFDVKRVTSVSADTHKYGGAEKGSSVIMYRDFDNWGKHQIFVETQWQGGIYATPTLSGSRSGRDIAATWAVMAYLGNDGYREQVKKVVTLAIDIIKLVKEDNRLKEYLELLGDPKAMVLAWRSKQPEKVDIYDVKKEMAAREWYLSSLQNPAGIHICLTPVHANTANFATMFVKGLRASVEEILKSSYVRGKSGDRAMYGVNAQFGKGLFVEDFARAYWGILCSAEPPK